jgi:hypothetical protein
LPTLNPNYANNLLGGASKKIYIIPIHIEIIRDIRFWVSLQVEMLNYIINYKGVTNSTFSSTFITSRVKRSHNRFNRMGKSQMCVNEILRAILAGATQVP